MVSSLRALSKYVRKSKSQAWKRRREKNPLRNGIKDGLGKASIALRSLPVANCCRFSRLFHFVAVVVYRGCKCHPTGFFANRDSHSGHQSLGPTLAYLHTYVIRPCVGYVCDRSIKLSSSEEVERTFFSGYISTDAIFSSLKLT